MKRIQPNKVTWQNDKKTLTLHYETGAIQVYIPRADDRALFKAARALIFAIEGRFNDRRSDNEDNRGRGESARHNRRNDNSARPNRMALRDPTAGDVAGAQRTESILSNDRPSDAPDASGGHASGEEL
jgi:hypothetical protein